MRPFSAMYFIKQNKSRCILLMFMIFLAYSAYIGGLYITNVTDNWEMAIEYTEKRVIVNAKSNDNNFSDFKKFKEELCTNKNLTVLELGEYSAFNWKTIMGYESGKVSTTFRSKEDFDTYCKYMNIKYDSEKIKNGSLIISKKLAKNRNLRIGDVVDKNFDIDVYGTYTVDAMTDEDSYFMYFIDERESTQPSVMILPDDAGSKEVYDIAYNLQKKYNVYIQDGLRKNINDQFENVNMIYTFIVMLTSVILGVTINAAFVGMYQRRTFEFAVYNAIGVSKKRIIRKIVSELLCMDIMSLFIGGVVVLTALYLFNNMVLYPEGLYLRYFHMTSLKGLILCNTILVIPLIITRCHQMLKADICEY